MKLAILSAVLMVLGITGVMVATLLRVHEHYDDTSLDYGVFMDAGSTSTKAYIFQWEHKITTTLPTVTMAKSSKNDLQTFKVKPGIASLAPNYSQVGDYLDPVINWAKSIIPEHRISATPIFFQGTGGLRELSNISGGAVLTNVRFKLQDCGFNFDNTFASIITGTEEAGYGFLAVNSLFNNFQAPEDSNKITTYGSLDMGGVSSAISFMSQNSPPAPYTFTSDIQTIIFYAQSDDGLGINAAREEFNRSLLGGFVPPCGYTVWNPCFPVGYFENVTLNFGDSQYWYIYTGAASNDTYSCSILVQQFVHQLTISLPVPPVTDLDVKHFFKLKDNANILELEAKVNSFCELTYGDAMGHHNKYANDVQYYCFMGNYIASLLRNYYGLSPTMRHILWKDTVQDMPVSWSLGSMQTYVQGLEPDTSSRSRIRAIRFFHTDGGIVLLFVSCLLFVLGLVLFILQRRRPTDYVMVR